MSVQQEFYATHVQLVYELHDKYVQKSIGEGLYLRVYANGKTVTVDQDGNETPFVGNETPFVGTPAGMLLGLRLRLFVTSYGFIGGMAAVALGCLMFIVNFTLIAGSGANPELVEYVFQTVTAKVVVGCGFFGLLSGFLIALYNVPKLFSVVGESFKIEPQHALPETAAPVGEVGSFIYVQRVNETAEQYAARIRANVEANAGRRNVILAVPFQKPNAGLFFGEGETRFINCNRADMPFLVEQFAHDFLRESRAEYERYCANIAQDFERYAAEFRANIEPDVSAEKAAHTFFSRLAMSCIFALFFASSVFAQTKTEALQKYLGNADQIAPKGDVQFGFETMTINRKSDGKHSFLYVLQDDRLFTDKASAGQLIRIRANGAIIPAVRTVANPAPAPVVERETSADPVRPRPLPGAKQGYSLPDSSEMSDALKRARDAMPTLEKKSRGFFLDLWATISEGIRYFFSIAALFIAMSWFGAYVASRETVITFCNSYAIGSDYIVQFYQTCKAVLFFAVVAFCLVLIFQLWVWVFILREMGAIWGLVVFALIVWLMARGANWLIPNMPIVLTNNGKRIVKQ